MTSGLERERERYLRRYLSDPLAGQGRWLALRFSHPAGGQVQRSPSFMRNVAELSVVPFLDEG